QAAAANAALADPGSSKVPRKEWVYHKVRRGEKLYSIAVKYGTTLKELKQINGLRSNNVRVGTLIKIRKNPVPTPTNAASKDSSVVNSTKKDSPKAGVVLDTTKNKDLAVSKAKTSAAGKSPEVNSSVASKSSVTFYKVRRGDSMYSISKKFENLTVEDLMRLNNLTNRSQLSPGMTLRVKAKK
ncbi:MAG: LysM peptidoglycan-binding domain-containing protein, partial [Bacteroidota bacterium]